MTATPIRLALMASLWLAGCASSPQKEPAQTPKDLLLYAVGENPRNRRFWGMWDDRFPRCALYVCDPADPQEPKQIGSLPEADAVPTFLWRAGSDSVVVQVADAYWLVDIEGRVAPTELPLLRGSRWIRHGKDRAFFLSPVRSDRPGRILAQDLDCASPPTVVDASEPLGDFLAAGTHGFWVGTATCGALLGFDEAGRQFARAELGPRCRPDTVDSEFSTDGSRLAIRWRNDEPDGPSMLLLLDARTGEELYRGQHDISVVTIVGSGPEQPMLMSQWVSAHGYMIELASEDECRIVDCASGSGVLREKRDGDLPPHPGDVMELYDEQVPLGEHWCLQSGELTFLLSGKTALDRSSPFDFNIVLSPGGRWVVALGFITEDSPEWSLVLVDGLLETVTLLAESPIADAVWLPAPGQPCQRGPSTARSHPSSWRVFEAPKEP